jgi:hypothetical protein
MPIFHPKLTPFSAEAKWFHMTLRSENGNGKTGPMPVTTSSMVTCPETCALREECYGKSGKVVLWWQKVTQAVATNLLTWDELCQKVKGITQGSPWRHNQVGDLPTNKRGSIHQPAMLKLARANREAQAKGWTYTHHEPTFENVRTLKQVNEAGFVVALSANGPWQVDEYMQHGLPVVTILPLNSPKVQTTPGGVRIVKCPEQWDGQTKCNTCGNGKPLCWRKERDYVVGFEAHGNMKASASRKSMQIELEVRV